VCFAATEDIRQKPSGTDVEISSLDDSMAVVGVRRRSLYNPVSSEQPACWHGGQELCVEPHSKSYAEVRTTDCAAPLQPTAAFGPPALRDQVQG